MESLDRIIIISPGEEPRIAVRPALEKYQTYRFKKGNQPAFAELVRSIHVRPFEFLFGQAVYGDLALRETSYLDLVIEASKQNTRRTMGDLGMPDPLDHFRKVLVFKPDDLYRSTIQDIKTRAQGSGRAIEIDEYPNLVFRVSLPDDRTTILRKPNLKTILLSEYISSQPKKHKGSDAGSFIRRLIP